MTTEKTFSEAEVRSLCHNVMTKLLNFPFSTVCVHFAAGTVIDEMEKIGLDTPAETVKAVVSADQYKIRKLFPLE